MVKSYLVTSCFALIVTVCLAQTDTSKYYSMTTTHIAYPIKTGFIYVKGLSWEENKKQDSVKHIFIEGDTMQVVRNLLEYCLQEKRENDNAGGLLRSLNLDYLKRLVNNAQFNYHLKEYKKAVARNKAIRKKLYPTTYRN